MHRLVLATSSAIVLAFFALGCGDETASTAAPSAAPAATPAASAAPSVTAAPAPSTAAGGVVEVAVTDKGFEPSRISAKVGEPVTLRITRKSEGTCATEIVIKDPPVKKELPLDTPVEVTVTPKTVGEIAFACAMDMVGGIIDVH